MSGDRFPKGDAMKLAEITGLTTAAATEAYTNNYSDFCCGLASIVQSKPHILERLFTDADRITKNARQINGWLRNIYELVGKVKDNTRCTPHEAWKFCAQAKWDSATAMKGDTAAKPKIENIYAKTAAERNTGPYFSIDGFWEKEIVAGCTLTGRNEGFIEATGKEKLRERMLEWVKRTSDMHGAPLQFCPIANPDEESVRVMILDAQRTFNEPVHRKKLAEFIYCFSQELGAFGQPMCYLAAVCLLALDEAETTRVLRMVGKDYIKGHWAAEARGFATNAWLTESFMQKRCPAVAKHLMSFKWWPHMYMQKILSGLTIHCLPWNYMFVFLDRFMERGFNYLMAFMLSVVEHFEKQLLACGAADVSTAFEILKLDPSVVEEADIKAIMHKADNDMAQWLADDIKTNDINLPLLRSEIYDSKLAQTLESVPKEEAFDPCEECEKAKPQWWDDGCEKYLCDPCRKSKHATCDVEEF